MTFPAAFLGPPIAHRALHDAGQGIPENGVTAVRRAVAMGYGIEIDVQPSADGQAMVFHDATLDRMTGTTGPIRARTARDLMDLRLKGSEENIASLSQILQLVAGRVPLLIEIKDQSGGIGAPADDMLERGVVTALQGYAGPVAVMSFNPHTIASFRAHAPNVARGLVTSGFMPSQWPGLSPELCSHLRSIRDFGKVGAQFISHDWTDLGSPRVAELKAQKIPVLCWTIQSAQAEAEARRIADNVTFEGYLPPLDPA
ncbi:glycerophosphodiester phosphodiesterase family protein [Boseongicola sp. H5]|uniref:glycerophosphodiester phosphodiesterase family protein n=1 Tax=Rhodobacterales TaxID=204455 RepID=UPI001B04CB34|nr:glycerophosphodiester phosphodiesterase family protein [Boseongicola sp. H5]MBO6602694.1 phosphodiesterase [Roseicyclus sp.]MBO6623925.1 phosphodiesterase [Roseicyclus sp.]MBO6923066.1 phosphodiesterase [Roseicyclus sp.]